MLKEYYLSVAIFASTITGFEAQAMQQPDDEDPKKSSVQAKQPSKAVSPKSSSDQTPAGKLHLVIKPYTDQVSILNTLHTNRDITSLNLSHTFFSDELALYLPKYCEKLTHLNLSFCEISDNGLDLLSRSYPGIQVLDLSMNLLTDKSLRSLAHNCNDLTSVNLTGNIKITATGVRDLVQQCKHLTYINLKLINVNDALLMDLRRMLPDLEIDGIKTKPSQVNEKNPNLSKKKKGGARKKKNKKAQKSMAAKVKANQSSPQNIKTEPPVGRDDGLLELHSSWEKGMKLIEEKKVEEGLDCLNKAISKLDPLDPFYQEGAAAIQRVNQILAAARNKK